MYDERCEMEEIMTEDLTLNMNAYLPLRDVVFHTLREAILKGELKNCYKFSFSYSEVKRLSKG